MKKLPITTLANNSEAHESSPEVRKEVKNYRSEKKLAEFSRKNVSMEFRKKDLRSASENIQHSPQITIPTDYTGLVENKMVRIGKKKS